MVVIDIDAFHYKSIHVAGQVGYELECDTALIDEEVADCIETNAFSLEIKSAAQCDHSTLTQTTR